MSSDPALQQENDAVLRFIGSSSSIVTRNSPRRREPRTRRGRRRRFLPDVDRMEGRTLLSTRTVTNNNDSGTGSLAPINRLPVLGR